MALDAPAALTRSAVDGIANGLGVAKPIGEAAARSVDSVPEERRDRTFAPLSLATVDRPGRTSSIIANAPEQRFAQETSALLVLMQLEKLPLLPNRSESPDDRNEQGKSTRDASIVRT